MTNYGGPVVWIELIQSDEGDEVLQIPPDRLVSFDFIDKDRGVDVAKLTLKNHDMIYYDRPEFRAGQKLLVNWGWPDRMGTQRRMIVKKPSEGSNPIVITMHDEAVLLDKRPKKRIWRGKTDGQIAADIASENGYDGILQDIQDTFVVREESAQIGSDAGFLETMARRNGFRWWVDSSGLHWKARDMIQEPSKYYVYRNDVKGEVISQPEIDANLSKDMAKIKVVAIDPLTRKEVSAEIGVVSGDEEFGEFIENIVSLGNEEEVGDPDNPSGAREARVSRAAEFNLGLATYDEVAAEAEKMYRETASKRYKMTAQVRGDPLVGAKQLHHWTMPSETMTGLWYCKMAETKISGGQYNITLHYLKDALAKLALERIHRITRKKNSKTDYELDENGIPKKTKGLTKVLSWGEENGNAVPKWGYEDKKGSSVGKSWSVTGEEWRDLKPAERDRIVKSGHGGLTLPGD